MWRRRPDDDDIAGAGNHLLAIHHHGCLTGEHDTSFSIGMLMQSRAFPWRKVAQKEGNAGAVGRAFELDAGDGALPLIAAMIAASAVWPSIDETTAALSRISTSGFAKKRRNWRSGPERACTPGSFGPDSARRRAADAAKARANGVSARRLRAILNSQGAGRLMPRKPERTE